MASVPLNAFPWRTPWAYETSPFELVPSVYYVGNKNVSSHLFDTGEGLLLLDTTYAETTYLLLESIRDAFKFLEESVALIRYINATDSSSQYNTGGD